MRNVHLLGCRVIHDFRRIVLVVIAALPALGGCTTIWQENFTGKPLPKEEAVLADAVELREVPWSRLASTLGSLEAERAASDISPQEWPIEKKEQAKAALLVGLQVSAPPQAVDIIGSSRFRTTEPLRADGGELAKFAGSIGANRVAYSYDYLGKADRIISEPVTTIGSGPVVWNPALGDAGWDPWGVNTTTWVPVVYAADEYAWAAYFLRVR